MKNKEKGSFFGFTSVFSFTAKQNMKGKGFALSSIGIGVLIFAICLAIPVIMAFVQKPDDAESDDYGIEEDFSENDLDAIVVLDHYGIDKNLLTDFLQLCGFENTEVEFSDLNVDDAYGDFAKYCTGHYENPIGMSIDADEDKIEISYYIFEDTGIGKDFVQNFAEAFKNYYDTNKYIGAGMTETEILLVNTPVWTQVNSTDKDENEMGVVIARAIIPAIFSLLLFMMICVYGQSVTKTVMSEKSSKLMEVLLTSVQPYALIAGKIMAVASIAIVQLLGWLVLGCAGFFAGNVAAEHIYPDYQNYVFLITDMIKESGTGFSVQSMILAVLMTILGFFLYCVWAGFIASMVDRVDDVSTAMSLFQIPAMAGFMMSYIGSLLESDLLVKISEYIPITSPFIMPADVLLGKASFAGGLVSFVLLAVFTMGMIFATGKIYKNKIFYRK